jgi:hypothetical protein
MPEIYPFMPEVLFYPRNVQHLIFLNCLRLPATAKLDDEEINNKSRQAKDKEEKEPRIKNSCP